MHAKSPTSRAERDARCFQQFLQALCSFYAGQPFELPTFTRATISAWRIFVQVFPAALRMLEAEISNQSVASSPNRKQRLLSAYLLTSTLANTEDQRLRSKAIKVLRSARDNACIDTLPHPSAYDLSRQYLFCRAEAEGGAWSTRCADYLWKVEKSYPGIDARFNRAYYRSHNRTTLHAQTRKLLTPCRRDTNTLRPTEVMIELLERDLSTKSDG